MQTFLPTPNFVEVAKLLDYRRLGKQRLEALECLNIILGKPLAEHFPDNKVYSGTRHDNHPCRWTWQGYPEWLAAYGSIICLEWTERGYVDNQLPIYGLLVEQFDLQVTEDNRPPWLGDEDIHYSHRSNLIQKRPDIYGELWPDVEPGIQYLWPKSKDGEWVRI